MIAPAGQTSRETEVQSGDTQGLSKAEQTNSESVEELAADGQAFEASAVSNVENAADPDVHEVEQEKCQGTIYPASTTNNEASVPDHGFMP